MIFDTDVMIWAFRGNAKNFKEVPLLDAMAFRA